jgi:undecaprenol kinase
MKDQNFFDRFTNVKKGLQSAWSTELSIRIEIFLGVAAVGLLFFLRPAPVWWAIVAIISGGVLTAELMNTALERLLDRMHPAHDPLIGQAKDCAAAAVFVMALASLAVLSALLYNELLS